MSGLVIGGTEKMKELFSSFIAIDGSKNMIEEAKKIHPELSEKLFHKTLPNNLDFDKKFDGIYSIATLMHLSEKDLRKTILKIYDLLNQNGKLFMSVSLFRDDVDENGFDDKGRFFLVFSFFFPPFKYFTFMKISLW